jgi:hypothetical protein
MLDLVEAVGIGHKCAVVCVFVVDLKNAISISYDESIFVQNDVGQGAVQICVKKWSAAIRLVYNWTPRSKSDSLD